MRWFLLLCSLALFPACGSDDSSGGEGKPIAEKPAQPDPAELERQRVEKERLAEERKQKLAAEKKSLKGEIAELNSKHKSMVAANEAEAAGLPDKVKLRRTLRQLIQDSGRKRGIYETNKKRLAAIEKEVRATATDEIKDLEKLIAKKDKEYNAILSGAKLERANADLGIVEETQVQKEIRTLREAKQKWFEVTRDTRRGLTSAKSKATRAFRAWCHEDALRKAVVGKALPKGKSTDGYDFSALDFYLFMELLEDTLDRLNVAEEKKTLSENDKKLVALEKAIDALEEKKAQLMTAGGGALEQYTDLKSRIGAEKAEAEGLGRQVEQMREVYNELDAIVERHKKAEYELELQIEAKEKRLKAVAREMR